MSVNTGYVEIEGYDEPLTVRGLTPAEFNRAGRRGGGLEGIEARMIAAGLVNPPLTDAEALRLARNQSSKVVLAILDKIAELSGLEDAPTRSALRAAKRMR